MKIREQIKVAQLYGYHYCKKSIELPYFPPVVWIEPTSRCNLKCDMCLTGTGQVAKGGKTGIMDISTYRKIIGELKDHPIIRLGLFFRGEPLIHPRIAEMVRIANDYGLNPYFHTNATLMTPDIAEKLIKSGLSYISFSFDCDSKEKYEAVRKGASFDRTLDNIRSFIRIKEVMGSPTPRVVIQSIDFDGRGITGRYRKLFEGYGVDEFVSSYPHNWSGEITGIPVVARGEYMCPDPWQRITILWNGDVVPCCRDMLQKMTLGNVGDETITAIWNNDDMKRLRTLIANGKNKETLLCRNCSAVNTDAWMI